MIWYTYILKIEDSISLIYFFLSGHNEYKNFKEKKLSYKGMYV